MTNTIARIKQAGKRFEIIVDLDSALKYKKGELTSIEIEGGAIFTDSKRGERSPISDIQEAFGTTDQNEIIDKILKKGEIQTNQDHRDAEHEKKIKQVVDFLATNAIDPQTKNPITPERIKSALEQSHINIKNAPVETQIKDILSELNKIIPIKIQTKKVKVIIPAIQTGQAYGVITQYKERENWLPNGDLEAILSIPAGILIDFYEKLNSITHGSALTEEIKEE